jgi:hypothetical protein
MSKALGAGGLKGNKIVPLYISVIILLRQMHTQQRDEWERIVVP